MPMIGGEGLRNVAITGRGTIDGRGQWWWQAMRDKTLAPHNVRPTLVRFVDSTNVRIEGITATNSPSWTVTPLACDNVVITGVTVVNPADSPNTDGINPDSCRNVRISDCHVDVGDDCITIKSGKETDNRRAPRACENVTITNCTLVHGHGGVVIGSEISGGIRNVAISNCVFVGTDRGIRIKARRGRGGVVEDVRVSNLVMDSVLCPLTVNLFYGCGAWGDAKVTDQSAHPVDAGTPRFRRLRFSNITARGVKWAAAYVLGLPEMFVEDVAYDGISIYMDPDNTAGGAPVMAPNVPDCCRAGIIVRNVERVALRNVDVSDQLGTGLSIASARDVVVDGVVLRTSADGVPLVQLDDVRDASVRRCVAPTGEPRPVAIRGEGTRGVQLADNRFGHGATAIDVGDEVGREQVVASPPLPT
jgi:hypothetical protein